MRSSVSILAGLVLCAYLVRRLQPTGPGQAPEYPTWSELVPSIPYPTWSDQGDQGDQAPAEDAQDQLPSAWSAAAASVAETLAAIPQSLGLASAPAAVDPDQAARNVRAFLLTIRYAEGTAGPDGYRTRFGGALFDSFADHPRIYTPFTNGRGETLKSSAAGAYQFLVKTWDSLARRLQLVDFGPESQDRAAVELIRQAGALADVQAGRFAQAVDKVRKIWASLPGAGYAQPEKKLPDLVARYVNQGGNLES